LARSDDAASVIAPLAGYATSTTGFLPEEVIRLSMQSQLQVRRGTYPGTQLDRSGRASEAASRLRV